MSEMLRYLENWSLAVAMATALFLSWRRGRWYRLRQDLAEPHSPSRQERFNEIAANFRLPEKPFLDPYEN